MKRTLLQLLFLLSLCGLALAQDPVQDSLDRVLGRVSTVRTEIVEFSSESGKRVKNPRWLLSFDQYAPNGRLTRGINYNPDGSIEYDYTPPADPNEKSGVIMCSHCDEPPLEYKTNPEYDDKGQILKESDYTTEGNLDGKRECRYDAKRNLIEEVSYHSDGSVFLKAQYRYDSAGNVEEYASYYGDGSLSSKEIYHYKYDTKGNWIERTIAICNCV